MPRESVTDVRRCAASYDEAGQLLGEYDADGSPVYETIYLNTLPVGALKQSGSAATGDIAVTVYNVHADHIDTPRVITRQDHTIVWRWDTAEAFGATAPDQNPSSLGAFVFNQRFPGQVFDAETGLHQNWNREYNAKLGRYIQIDPIGLEGGINVFAYAAGNPLIFIDQRGLDNPGMGPYGPGPNNYGQGASPFTQTGQALGDFWRNYGDMRDANTINADKYFHCKANCEATRRGPAGEAAACLVSDVREWTDQHVKGDPASASRADHAANAVGRSGALSSPQSCSAVCGSFRPNGLPSKY